MVGTAQVRLCPTLRSQFSNSIIPRHNFAIPPLVCASLSKIPCHLKIRGRRECRAPDAPAALRAKVRVARTQVDTVTPESPGIPRAMVYGLFRALPGDRALLPRSFA